MEEFKVDILKADVPTRNGNCYSSEALQKAIDEWKAKELPMYGIIGCPIGAAVNLKDVAFTVSDMKIEDGKMVGTVKVLETPQGVILKDLIDGHVPISYRPCSIGNIHIRENKVKDVTDVHLICINVIPEDDAS